MTIILSPLLFEIIVPFLGCSSLIKLTASCKLFHQHPIVAIEAKRRFPLYFQFYDLAILVNSSLFPLLFSSYRSSLSIFSSRSLLSFSTLLFSLPFSSIFSSIFLFFQLNFHIKTDSTIRVPCSLREFFIRVYFFRKYDKLPILPKFPDKPPDMWTYVAGANPSLLSYTHIFRIAPPFI